MSTQVHAPRRVPSEAEGPLDLRVAADELLAEAAGLHAGRSARTLTPGSGAPLKQTLLALRAGERLQDHRAPGPTTLLGVRGTAVLHFDGRSVSLSEHVWTPCPAGPHALEAISDAVVLITVAPAVDAAVAA